MGGGWQALVAYINLGSYYIFGLPLGFVLGYVANLGVTVSEISNLAMVDHLWRANLDFYLHKIQIWG